MGLEKIVINISERLKKEYPLKSIFISSRVSRRDLCLQDLDSLKIKKLISDSNMIYFHGTEVPKKSWYKVSNIYRTIRNAGVIEICKSIPYFPNIDIKNCLLKSIGVNLGKDVTIAPRVQFDYFYPELITIGDGSLIGDGAKLWTHEYGIDYFAVGEIKIGKNVYVGSEAIIAPGVIQDNSNVKARAIIALGKDFSSD